MVAGGTAASVAKTTMAPIERVKLLLQLQAVSTQMVKNQEYKGVLDCLVRIPREQGFLSFWRGNMTSVSRYFIVQALNFAFKEAYKPYLTGTGDSGFLRTLTTNLASGGAAGVSSMVITYPLDFGRTRLAADIGGPKHQRQFSGLFDCLRKVAAKDGIGGMYRGISLSVPTVLVFRSTYFGMYDTAKQMLDPERNSIVLSWAIAQVTTTAAGLLCYPMDTVRRRMVMQSGLDPSQRHYQSAIDCWNKMYRNEGGVSAFYKGAVANVFRGMGGAMVLILYDEIKQHI